MAKHLKQRIRPFKTVLSRAWKSFLEHHSLIRSAAITYATVIALMPFLVLLSVIAGHFGYWDFITENLPQLLNSAHIVLPVDQLTPILERTHNLSVGSIGIWGFLLLFVSFVAAMGNLETNMNVVWKARKNRNPLHRFLIYLPFAFVLVLFIASLSMILGEFKEWLEAGFLQNKEQIWQELIFTPHTLHFSFTAVLAFFTWIFLLSLYLLIPYTKVRLSVAFATSTLTWLMVSGIATASFSLQKVVFDRLSVLYGSLSFLPFLMIVLYVLWAIVLWGNAVACELQKWLEEKENPDHDTAKPEQG
jgi:membrane protein